MKIKIKIKAVMNTGIGSNKTQVSLVCDNLERNTDEQMKIDELNKLAGKTVTICT